MRSACLTAVAALLFGPGVVAVEPPLPQNRIAPPELGPIEPLHPRFAGSMLPVAGTDITVAALGFDADGRISYVMVNRGRAASGSPFVADIEVSGKRADTVKHPALPPQSQQRVVSNIAESLNCGLARLRVFADSQRLVAESDEANNALLREVVPPCPDLVASIEKDSLNNNLEYQAKAVVTNRGTMKPRREVTFRFEGHVNPGGTPWIKERKVPPLAPGESFKVTEDEKHWGTTSCSYHVVVDRFGDVPESNETNNVAQRSL